MSNYTRNQYFATLDDKQFVAAVQERVNKFGTHRTKYEARWKRNYDLYYNKQNGEFDMSTSIRLAGEQGELVEVGINQLRNIALHVINLITTNRPAWKSQAINTTAGATAQTRLANALLEYVSKDKNVASNLDTAVEHCLIYDAGYVKIEWDTQDGEMEMLNMEGMPVTQGDIRVTNPTAWDIVFDVQKKRFSDNDWIIHRSLKNKWELVAQFPEYADKLYDLKLCNDDLNRPFRDEDLADNSDLIEVYEFYHRKRPATLADGRYALIAGDNILLDVPLPYTDIPIIQVTAGDDVESQFGYSMVNDLAPLQEMINSEYSTIMSNHNAFGVQNIAVPREGQVNVNKLRGGMNLVEYNVTEGGAPPHALSLAQTPQEIMVFLDKLEHTMETISGINSVVRGNPEASLKSGTALALVQNTAVQYMNKLQRSFSNLVARTGTHIVRAYQQNAESDRVISITGRSNQSYMKAFKGEDINEVKLVQVEQVNPLTQTTAGKVEMAQSLVQTGLITTAEEYLSVVETGNLEVMTEHNSKELQTIRSENEDLLDGVGARALLTDDHRLHILEHKTILSDPAMRADEQLTNMVLSHMQEHMDYLMNPAAAPFLQILGQQSMAQPMDPNMDPSLMQDPSATPTAPGEPEANLPQPAQSPTPAPEAPVT